MQLSLTKYEAAVQDCRDHAARCRRRAVQYSEISPTMREHYLLTARQYERIGASLDKALRQLDKAILDPEAERPHDHDYEPGAYGVCRRCGNERH